ncbi:MULTISPECIES: tRNA uridine-5-carboxymethylaminomethyl(34) synthesis GTPase MnmE [Prochlorococcus]|uniref:tRNA modification GTPase MnmE n=1 Tax=Prochlorococcus marinus (strain SARG / CCMP1375 / SS120) TaxID=167539 RepID=MNME_PROMA|nr:MULTISPECIES: tRNA uridine-5-carboxymethylaminomethyl(34) synthesis GTPase MnmE [Prochlorococcus]Q7VE01.1 RecName: Full=tRNA modification GTPase MnmE [Prochlorococcus marinus subsp. marinus str. CCMP1375]AAP99260.1 Predicted GTPase [Prochlorococcus marinus subsp. marinus str. CCMP1375]KGG11470.1 GTPase and tRNA-U34 5-formylation enzyme TrmE [Prochlorococcus marinus str. LG]KGG18576.1 GTPase and tRNA-U34 5-formylation enzyme TrmE [Prochlorococcus marinus str. SS2]KGG22849.1 GTPase and tRNA-U
MDLAFSTEENIAAIASAVAPGQGAIAIVKVSGASAKEVVKNVVRTPSNKIWSSHKILYGHVIDKSTKKNIDEVLILIMDGPRSFTGEDVVEIHCHGGLIVVQQVLDAILKQPKTRRAFPGEFSQRAVLNGRLDITQAEAINDLIHARSQKAAQLAIAGIDGDITNKINYLREKLLDQLSEIEARIDFEEDLPKLNSKKLLTDLMLIRAELKQLINDAKQGSLIRNGLKVALVGLPNVGKSSILNLLSKHERAIVTDLPGTTRDLLESEIILEGVPITLIDTAGIRETNNEIEKIGVSLSQKTLFTADIVVLIFDLSKGWNKNDQNLLEKIPKGTPTLIIGNKADLKSQSTNIQPHATMTAITGEGEKELIQELLKLAGANELEGIEVALNQRQLDLVKVAVNALDQIEKVAAESLAWDFWTIDLREAIYKLGELTGEEVTEALLDRIFSRFCIGK